MASMENPQTGLVPATLAESMDGDSLAGLTASILEDCLYNILHDTVLRVHREEKLLRMQSAVIIVEKAAAAAAATTATASTTSTHTNGPLSTTTSPSSLNHEPKIKVTTPGAIYEDGKVYLTGNPLQTTPEIFCPNCKLPRLLYPTTGKGSQRIPDPSKEYCAKRPYIDKPGHDIHGNPFYTDKLSTKNTSSKPRKDNGKTPAPGDKTSPPSSSDTLTGSPPEQARAQEQVAVVSFPTVKCPNCPRYLVVTRIAQHLDKCLGISGRQSSRNAMKRMTTTTPGDSRAGTSAASGLGTGKRKSYAEESESEEDTPRRKKRRVGLKKKIKGAGKKPVAAKTTGKKPVASKTTPKSKREDEEDDEEWGDTPRKKTVGCKTARKRVQDQDQDEDEEYKDG